MTATFVDLWLNRCMGVWMLTCTAVGTIRLLAEIGHLLGSFLARCQPHGEVSDRRIVVYAWLFLLACPFTMGFLTFEAIMSFAYKFIQPMM